MQAPPVTEELRLLLQEFQHELDGGLANEPFTDSSYWHCVELKFTLRCLHVAAFKSFETALLLGHGRGIIHAKPAREAQARLTEVSDLMQQVLPPPVRLRIPFAPPLPVGRRHESEFDSCSVRCERKRCAFITACNSPLIVV